jgi:hypothetical protein
MLSVQQRIKRLEYAVFNQLDVENDRLITSIAQQELPGGLTFIAEQVLLVDTPAQPGQGITFSAIPQDFRHLRLMSLVRSSNAGLDNVRVRLNGDAGANYDAHIAKIFDNNITHAESGLTGTGAMDWFVNTGPPTNIRLSDVTGSTAPANMATFIETTFPFYSNTTWQKAVYSRGHLGNNAQIGAGAGGGPSITLYTGRWFNTAAISSINIILSLGANLMAGSRFALYGY